MEIPVGARRGIRADTQVRPYNYGVGWPRWGRRMRRPTHDGSSAQARPAYCGE